MTRKGIRRTYSPRILMGPYSIASYNTQPQYMCVNNVEVEAPCINFLSRSAGISSTKNQSLPFSYMSYDGKNWVPGSISAPVDDICKVVESWKLSICVRDQKIIHTILSKLQNQFTNIFFFFFFTKDKNVLPKGKFRLILKGEYCWISTVNQTLKNLWHEINSTFSTKHWSFCVLHFLFIV
jgi:hypothetical protein